MGGPGGFRVYGCVLIPAAGFLLAGTAGFVPTFAPSVAAPIGSSVSELSLGVPSVELRVTLPCGDGAIGLEHLSSPARDLAGSDSRGACAGA